MQIGCTLAPYLCFVNKPKGLRQVNPKFNFCVMKNANLLGLSKKQTEDLRNLFSIWMKQKGDVLIDTLYATHDDCATLFLREVADAIICDVSIMTIEEQNKDRISWYNSMEGLED